MQWENIFRRHILERGCDYHNRGLVKIEEYSTDVVVAKVKGSLVYDVKIEFKEQSVQAISCNCPHAADGNFCKHAAAVLYTAESQTIQLSDIENKKENIQKLVSEADEKTVRHFLIEVLEENYSLRNRFKRNIGQEISKEEILIYKNVIDEIFYSNSGSYGFVDYYEAMELEVDLEIFIENEIEKNLLRNGYYEEAFELTTKIFLEISDTDMDDSGGITINIVHYCKKIWNEILKKSNVDLTRKMYQWFKKQLDSQLLDYMEECVEEVLFDAFMEEEFIEDKLKLSKEKFELYKNEKSQWLRDYKAQEWAVKYLELLEQLNKSEQLNDFCKNNLMFPRVREFYVEQLLNKNEYETAIKLLEEGKKSDKSILTSGISRTYRKKLKDLYKKVDNEEAYRTELWDLIINRRSIDFDLYQEYKTLYTKAEWNEKRLNIIRKLLDASGIDQILAEEKFYDMLLEYALNQHSLHLLQKHQELLIKFYPNQVFERYEKEILSLSEFSGPRKKYRQVVSLIHQMQGLPNSKERASKIVSYLRTTYSNRPAMMDELGKLWLSK